MLYNFRYLYQNIKLLLQKKISDVLDFNESLGKFSLKPDIKLHFFVSHVPCMYNLFYLKLLIFIIFHSILNIFFMLLNLFYVSLSF